MHVLAYIDPGSGSLLLQALLAGLLAIPFFFRRTIGSFVHRLRGGTGTEAAAPVERETDAPEEPGR